MGVCNVGYMSIAQNHAIRPYADLAQQLGRVATQFAMGTVWKITLASWGQTDISITSPDARALLKAQALVGFLSTQDTHGTLPGIVNAPFLAEELGVETEALTEAPALASAASPYRSLITVVAHVEGGGATSVTGSVFGHEPCLVSLDHYKNFPALNLHEGSVLKFRNKVGRAGGGAGRRAGRRVVYTRGLPLDPAFGFHYLAPCPHSAVPGGARRLCAISDTGSFLYLPPPLCLATSPSLPFYRGRPPRERERSYPPCALIERSKRSFFPPPRHRTSQGPFQGCWTCWRSTRWGGK